MDLKYINSDYVPKGDLENFPLEVIDKMLERQAEQGCFLFHTFVTLM